MTERPTPGRRGPLVRMADNIRLKLVPDRGQQNKIRMGLALSDTDRHVYAGTVSPEEKRRRRARGKRSRTARAMHRRVAKR